MTNRRRYYAAMTAEETRLNYPGALHEAAPVGVSTVKSQVDYPTYVSGHGKRMALYGAIAFAGAAVAIGGMMAVSVPWVFFLVGFGGTLLFSGAVGLWAEYNAHEDWSRYGYGVSTKWETTAPPPPEKRETVRAFVASENGRQINTGRLDFSPTVWRDLLDVALANNGYVTKDGARKAGVERRWYHTDPNSPDGYRAFLAELRQLRFVDERNRLTDVVLAWYAAQFPALPLSAIGLRPNSDRPTDGSTATDPDGYGVGG
jgi:hypothetical protein